MNNVNIYLNKGRLHSGLQYSYIRLQSITYVLLQILVSAIIFSIFGFSLGRMKKFVKFFNPISKFWRNFSLHNTLIIVPTYGKYSEDALKKGIGALDAASNIQSCIKKISNNRVKIIEERFAEEQLVDNNIILIGGSITNKITDKMLKYFPFAFDGHTLIKSDSNTTLAPDYPLEDYGLLIMSRNPKNKSRFMAILAGCYGYGTSIIADSLCNPKKIKKIIKILKLNEIDENFITVLKADIQDDHYGPFSIIHTEAL